MTGRIFVVDGKEYPDLDPNLTIEEAREQLANFMPDLVNAEYTETKRGMDTIIELHRRTGTKGG